MVNFTYWNSPRMSTDGWVYNVSPSGTFICPPNLPITFGESSIPEGWTVINDSDETPLTFTAEESNSTIKLSIYGEPVVDGLQYRLNERDEWQRYKIGTEIELKNIGDYVQFQNTNNELSTGYADYVKFKMTGKIAASGNIQSMLNYSTSCTPYCYFNMFYGCTSLVKAPELPATTLADSCYQYMFYNCTSLTKAPELPATTLADEAEECYDSMFWGCTSLNYIKVGFTNWNSAVGATTFWLKNVSTTGTFVCPSTLDTTKRGYSYIPVDWTIENKHDEDNLKLEYLEVKTSEPETSSWMNEVGLVTTVTTGTTMTLEARPIPENAGVLVHEYKWFVGNSLGELDYKFKGGGENGNIGQKVELLCNYLPLGTYFYVEAYDINGNYLLSSNDFAIETEAGAGEVIPPDEPEIPPDEPEIPPVEPEIPDDDDETTKKFQRIEKVAPLAELITIDNDGLVETHESEITLTVKIYPEDTIDSVEINWSSNGDVALSTYSGLSCTTKGFIGDAETHYVYATPVVNGIEQTDKRIGWAFHYYSTCTHCGHRDLTYNLNNQGWPMCPSCGKPQ